MGKGKSATFISLKAPNREACGGEADNVFDDGKRDVGNLGGHQRPACIVWRAVRVGLRVPPFQPFCGQVHHLQNW